MSDDWVGDVERMHTKFGHREVASSMESSALLELVEFRLKFLREELSETESAESPEEFVDGLIDLCVVAIGTLDLIGADAREAWTRVMTANLEKTSGENRKRGGSGMPDLVKPPGWAPPDHAGNVGRLAGIYSIRRPGKVEAFQRFAESLAAMSHCARRKVGCLIVPPSLTEVVAVGYNGPPAKLPNDGCRGSEGSCGCVHAEANAVAKLKTEREGLVMLVTAAPCELCAGLTVNCGRVGEVRYRDDYRDDSGLRVLDKAGVKVRRWSDAT